MRGEFTPERVILGLAGSLRVEPGPTLTRSPNIVRAAISSARPSSGPLLSIPFVLREHDPIYHFVVGLKRCFPDVLSKRLPIGALHSNLRVGILVALEKLYLINIFY